MITAPTTITRQRIYLVAGMLGAWRASWHVPLPKDTALEPVVLT
jgi:hypothetical protein